ncbi:MAG: hypothetical protein R2766_05215 [Saprospiraceae bacterium]
MPKWVVNYTQLHQINIENEAALMVAELLGNDLNKIANEMDKVFIGHDKSKKLTRADIQESIGLSKEYNVFELQKFIGMRDFVSCIRIVNYMGDNPKNNPLPMLLASLYSYRKGLYRFGKHEIWRCRHDESPRSEFTLFPARI